MLLAPLAILALPFVAACGALRASVLRSRAKLAGGLAVRYCRNPVALAQGLRRIFEDPKEVRRGDPRNAHLWLEYPHTRASQAASAAPTASFPAGSGTSSATHTG